MTEIRLKVENDMAKAEEIAILEKLSNVFSGTGNYLTSLFTTDFVGWATNMIKNDFPVNVMEYINDHEKDKIIGDLQNIARTLELEMDKIKIDKLDLVKENEKLRDRISECYTEISRLGRDYEKEHNRMVDEVMQAQEEGNRHLSEVIKLKSKIYDLIMKEQL